MLNIKIGICITTYNNQNIIENNLISSLQQKTTIPFKVYVVDDGSTDNTPQILNIIASAHNNFHLTLATHGERGIARTTAVNNAIFDGCTHFLFIDSDMYLESDLLEKCYYKMKESGASALIVPEVPISQHNNFMTRVKIFERTVVNNVGSIVDSNSIEAARFWDTKEYLRSGGLNSKQIAFEETQPTIRIIEKGGKVLRVVETKLYHDEGKVTFFNLFKKKLFYFTNIDKTTSTEPKGFIKALQRWYFFRPYMYSKSNLILFIQHPIKFMGLLFMYIGLTATAALAALYSYIKTKENLEL